MNNIANVVPDDCYVDQVAYVVRHGSRFPDSGAYKEWTTLYSKVRDPHYGRKLPGLIMTRYKQQLSLQRAN